VLDRLRRGRPYLLELGGGLLILAVVNLLLRPRDPGFLAVQPNPTLLLVAVVACRHGLRAGLASGLVTAALVAAGIVARLEDLTWTELRTLGHYVTPILLIGTGFGLGAQRESQQRAARARESRIEAIEHELADQAVRFMAATEAKHELERGRALYVDDDIIVDHGFVTASGPHAARAFADAVVRAVLAHGTARQEAR